jgi:hypothetical protein
MEPTVSGRSGVRAEQRLLDLVAQQEIRDVLIRYTRGVDRLDKALVRSTYWPGAHDDHGAFQGTVEEFVEWLNVLEHFDSTMHFIGNQLVEVDGDTAHAESYCVAYHRRGARDGEQGYDLVLGLRYIDRMERRPASSVPHGRRLVSRRRARLARTERGECRIADRTCVFDWSRHDPITAEWQLPPEAIHGRRDPSDPVYERGAS